MELLPVPGAPVKPTSSAFPVQANSSCTMRSASGSRFSRALMARAMARGSPLRTPSTTEAAWTPADFLNSSLALCLGVAGR